MVSGDAHSMDYFVGFFSTLNIADGYIVVNKVAYAFGFLMVILKMIQLIVFVHNCLRQSGSGGCDYSTGAK